MFLMFRLVLAVAVMTVAMAAMTFVVQMALVIVRNLTKFKEAHFGVLFVATFAEIIFIHNAVRGKHHHYGGNHGQYGSE
jgi:hypothetical protein